MIPPLLLMWYNFIGRGGSLRALCTVCYYVSSLCGILAVVLLWLVYPKDVSACPLWRILLLANPALQPVKPVP